MGEFLPDSYPNSGRGYSSATVLRGLQRSESAAGTRRLGTTQHKAFFTSRSMLSISMGHRWKTAPASDLWREVAASFGVIKKAPLSKLGRF